MGGKGEDNASIHSSDGLDVEVLVQELQVWLDWVGLCCVVKAILG